MSGSEGKSGSRTRSQRVDRGSRGHYAVTMKKRARRTISAADFKAHCLALLDEVSTTREPLIVTKRGKPVAKVVAIEPHADHKPLRGSVRFVGDVVGPIDEAWNALR